jgi:predicted SAM-dependent methyltransferase
MLVNIGCGSSRPSAPWVNVDTLREYLGPGGQWERAGSPEALESLRQLEQEPNYRNWDCRGAWPLADESADGVLMNHVLEHLDCQEALAALREAQRVLAPGGVLRVGVPDPEAFRIRFRRDCAANCEALFGEPLRPGMPATFTEGALFFKEHRQVLGEDALWCHLAVAGFAPDGIARRLFQGGRLPALCALDNREKFTLFMEAVK